MFFPLYTNQLLSQGSTNCSAEFTEIRKTDAVFALMQEVLGSWRVIRDLWENLALGAEQDAG